MRKPYLLVEGLDGRGDPGGRVVRNRHLRGGVDQVICTQKGRTDMMQDEMIIELYFRRDERALMETSDKYGHYCRTIARSILRDEGNVEECFNDTLFCSWKTIPPTRPNCFKLFLAKITRNLSLKRIERDYAAKRGGGEAVASIDELSECMSDKPEEEAEQIVEDMVIREVLERFLTKCRKKPAVYLYGVIGIAVRSKRSRLRSICLRQM